MTTTTSAARNDQKIMVTFYKLGKALGARFFVLAGLIAGVVNLPALAAEDLVRGGTLNMVQLGDPSTLVGAFSGAGNVQSVSSKIFESLLRYDFNLNPLPSLAKSWTISGDGLTYTFQLQDGVKWQDGQPLTADDVVFSIQEVAIKKTPSARQAFGAAESIKALDDHTVEFKLKKRFAPFIFAFSTEVSTIVPKHILQGTDWDKNPINQKPVGTGPFMIEEWKPGEYIHLVKNPNYWQKDMPYIDEIYFRTIPDAATRALAIETGQIDLTSFSSLSYPENVRLGKKDNLTLDLRGGEYFSWVMYLEMNNRKPPMNDVRFRRAVNYAIDRDKINQLVYLGLAKPMTSPFHSALKHFDPAIHIPEYDQEKANALLDEMGLKPNANGIRARVNLDTLAEAEDWMRMAEIVKQQLKRVGIDVNIRALDLAAWTDSMGQRSFDMVFSDIFQLGHPALGITGTVLSANDEAGNPFSNISGNHDLELDKMFERGGNALTDAEAQAAYSEAQKRMIEDMATIWLLELPTPHLVNKRVHNAISTALGLRDSYADVFIVDPK